MDDGFGTDERRRQLREQPVIGVEARDGATVVHLGGELDLYNAPMLRAALLAAANAEPSRLVIDLAEVEFIDSTALGALVEARGKLAPRSPLLLAAPQPEARRALQISGLDRHLAVHDTVDAALAAPA